MKKNLNLNCWVITEGLIGTENQCLGLTDELGLTPKVFQVNLNQPWKSLSPYLGFEQSSTFDPPLQAPWPDIVVGGGRKAIAALRYIKKQSPQTKTIFMQDPRIAPSAFDLVVAPEHDPIKGSNVIKTKGAINRVTPQKLDDAAKAFPKLANMAHPKLAVLIGGNSKSHTLTNAATHKLCEQLRLVDQSLMVTTSRRTGAYNTAIIENAFKDTDIFIWDGKGENPYFAMLALADAILVTNDSVSMLSDAASTGKPVYAIPLEGGSKRLDKMMNGLIEYGAVRIFEGKIETWDYKPLNDAQLAADQVKERLALV